MSPNGARTRTWFLKFMLIGTISSLSSCRHNQGGRVSRRANIPPTQPRVAECLKTHGLRRRALEAGCYTVIEYEPETLAYVRQKPQMPSALHGCREVEFLGYFLEGHISPAVLERIARDRPPGAGFDTAVTFTTDAANISTADEESSPVRLVDARGNRTTFAGAATNAVR